MRTFEAPNLKLPTNELDFLDYRTANFPMIYEANPLAIAVFSILVLGVLAFSFYLGAKAKSSQGYFAAGGSIPWFANGIAFAGD